MNKFILAEDGRTPVMENDIFIWGRWFEKNNDKRIVARNETVQGRVSTVFLGLDHSFDGGTPVLWETMVFGGELDGEQDRYVSYEDAIAGHAKILSKVMATAKSDGGLPSDVRTQTR